MKFVKFKPIVAKILTLLWYGVICYFSHQSSDQIQWASSIWDKSLHFMVYLILGWFYIQGFGRQYFWVVLPVLAMTDEIHQYFIPGRVMSLSDMVADVMGAGFVYLNWKYFKSMKDMQL